MAYAIKTGAFGVPLTEYACPDNRSPNGYVCADYCRPANTFLDKESAQVAIDMFNAKRRALGRKGSRRFLIVQV